jgi:transketolase
MTLVAEITTTDLDQLSINTIRTLSMDAVQQAKSGPPGTPMALAPLVYTIWNRVMRFHPQDPIWPNRDRFVPSNGHASMLHWSVLHLTRVQAVNADYEKLGHVSVTLDDIRHFRQLDSRAPGHPEYHWVPGVETTTGPLDRASRRASGWPSRKNGWPTATTALVFLYSTTAFMRSPEMAA